MLTEAKGIPVGLAVAGANRHDMKLVWATVDSIPVERPAFTREEPQGLCLDKGYDFDEVRRTIEEFGFTAHIRSRGEEAGGLGRYRHFQGFDVEPAGPLAHPVLVDGLDAVGVVSAGRYRVVGVGGRRCARVSHQFTELAPGIVHADAPQDLVRMIRLRDEEGNATTYLSNLIDRSRRAV